MRLIMMHETDARREANQIPSAELFANMEPHNDHHHYRL